MEFIRKSISGHILDWYIIYICLSGFWPSHRLMAFKITWHKFTIDDSVAHKNHIYTFEVTADTEVNCQNWWKLCLSVKHQEYLLCRLDNVALSAIDFSLSKVTTCIFFNKSSSIKIMRWLIQLKNKHWFFNFHNVSNTNKTWENPLKSFTFIF